MPDRANAQLEVTALLAEIDKIAGNAAFNEVKILDGTYSQDIRAGNTNPEIYQREHRPHEHRLTRWSKPSWNKLRSQQTISLLM